jgi:hypothetical protein
MEGKSNNYMNSNPPFKEKREMLIQIGMSAGALKGNSMSFVVELINNNPIAVKRMIIAFWRPGISTVWVIVIGKT